MYQDKGLYRQRSLGMCKEVREWQARAAGKMPGGPV